MHPAIVRLAKPALLAALLAACVPLVAEPDAVSAIVAASPPPDRVRLIVYRPGATHLLGAVGERPIEITAQPACPLGNDRFLVRDMAAGPITITDGTARLDLTTEPGRRYIVRVAFNPRRASLAGWILPLIGFGPDAQAPEAGPFAIEAIDPAQAAAELAGVSPEPACP